jgi:hypothetical protein
MKIRLYTVVAAQTTSSLVRDVNSYIQDGYQPYGDMVKDPTSTMSWFYQPMVKYEENEK